MTASIFCSTKQFTAAAAPATSQIPIVAASSNPGGTMPGAARNMPMTAQNTINDTTRGLVRLRNWRRWKRATAEASCTGGNFITLRTEYTRGGWFPPRRRENRRHPVLHRDPRKPRLGAVFPGDRPGPVQSRRQGARIARRVVADAVSAAHGRLLLRPHSRQDHLG